MLVIGLGNTDRGDDGVGPAVAERIGALQLQGVSVRTVTSHPLDLLDECGSADAVIWIDAAAVGEQPGRIQRLDPDADTLSRSSSCSSHAFGLAETIALGRSLRRLPPRVVVYTVTGACFDTGAALSAPVSAAVVEVVARVRAELSELHRACGAGGT